LTFTADLDDLIKNSYGDVKKLREIRDTIRHDNFITTDDKNYVESLITTYLKNQPLDKSLSHKQTDTKIELQPKSTTSSADSKNDFAISSSSKKKFGIIGGVAAAIAIVVIAGFTGIVPTDIIIDSGVSSTITEPLLVNVDQTTYQRADIISISGNSQSASTQSVELTIENTDGIKIWKENINPKKDGKFSTLVIAGGGGWENDGTYTLKAIQNDIANEIEFKFVA